MREDGEHLVGANDHEDADQGSIPHAPDAPKTRLQAAWIAVRRVETPARWSMPERQWR
jgi:hypothetical protein